MSIVMRLREAIEAFVGRDIKYEDKSAQATERQQWLEAIHQVSIQLAGFESLDSLMQLAVQIARDRLNSEVSSLFILEDNRLRRKAIVGIEADWFGEESYRIGEGITGSCLVTADGTKYGRSVLENAVGQSPQVVEEHLRKYQDKLASGQIRHLIAVPLNSREGPFGVLRVVNKLHEDGQLCETGFAEEDMNLLNTMACEIAIAVEKARLLEETQQHMGELSQLQQSSQALLSSLDLQSVLNRIAALAASLVQADYAKVVLNEDEGLVVGAHSSRDLASLPGKPRPDGVTRQVIETGAPVIFDEVSDDGTHNPDLVAKGFRSYAGIPITGQDRVLGVLFVFSLRPCAFKERIPLLRAFAGQAAIAIENSRLFELEQKRRRLAETLRETSEVVGSTLNLERVLALILDQVRRVVPYDTASVQLLIGHELEIIACRGVNRPDEVLKLTFPVDFDFPNYHVIVNKKPYVADNVPSRYPHFQNAQDEYYQATHVRSWLGVPLLFKGQIIGLMSLDSKTVDYYRKEHAQLAMAFANQAAMAIANARLHEKVQSRLSESTALVEVSKSLLQVSGLEDLLQLIIDSAVKLIGPAEGGMIHLLDKDTKKLQPKAWSGADPASVQEATLMEMGQGIAGHVIKKPETVNVPDVSKDPQFDESARASYFSSLMVAPMYIGRGEKRIGTLSVHSKAVGAFTDNHETLLTTLASQAATAIANAELLDIRQQKREQLQGILEVYKDFDVDIGMDALLQRIAQAAREVLGFNVVALKIVDPVGQNFIVRAVGKPDEDWQSRMIGAAIPLAKIKNLMQEEYKVSRSYLIQHGQELWDRVAEKHVSTLDLSDRARAHWLPDTAILVPLETQDDRLIGVLALSGPRSHKPPSKDDIQISEIFASTATVVIENARFKEFNENIVQGMEGGVLVEDAEGYIRFVNPKMATMLGYSRAELAGQHWSKIVPPGWIEKVAQETKKRAQGVKGRYEAALLHRDGIEIPVAINANPLLENEEFTGVLTVFTDIRATKRRLEDELHEAMNFFHSGVMCGIEAAKYRLEKGQYELVEAELEQVWRASRYTYSELDNILLDLTDPVLEKQGLGPALERYTGLVARDFVSVKADYEGRLRPDVEHALFRIAQGAIANAVRHAELEQVSGGKVLVRLTREGETICLSIMDNGKGFDVAIMDQHTRAFGLVRMREWAKALGTTLRVESAPGEGTKVMVTIPAKEAK